jgi:hypothetical protein
LPTGVYGQTDFYWVKPDCSTLWDRVAGRTFALKTSHSAGSNYQVGWDTATAGDLDDGAFEIVNATSLYRWDATREELIAAIVAGTQYTLYNMLRAPGVYHLAKDGAFGTIPLLIGVDDVLANATVAAGVSNLDGDPTIPTSAVKDLPVITPVLSDTFSIAGTSDGLVAPVDVAGAGAGVARLRALTVAGNKGYSNSTPGAELLTNGDFANWTGDALNDWTQSPADGANNEVCEVATGEAHADCGTPGGGMANIWRSGGAGLTFLRQSVFTVGGWYKIVTDIDTATSGQLQIEDDGGGIRKEYTTSGTKTLTGRAKSALFDVQTDADPTDFTLDSISVKQLTLSELLYLSEPGDAGAYSRASYTITDDTQAGRAVCWDSQTNPQNGIIAYANRVDGKVYLDKMVGGTWSNVASAAITYSASGQVKVYPINSARTLWNVEYDGTTEIQGASIADAGIIDNTLHGHFMTDNASYAEDEQIWNSQQPQLAGVV